MYAVASSPIGLGLFLSVLVTQAVSMEGLPFSVPVQTLAGSSSTGVAALTWTWRVGVMKHTHVSEFTGTGMLVLDHVGRSSGLLGIV